MRLLLLGRWQRKHVLGHTTETVAVCSAELIKSVTVAPLALLHARSRVFEARVLLGASRGWLWLWFARRLAARRFVEAAAARFVLSVQSLAVVFVAGTVVAVDDARTLLEAALRHNETVRWGSWARARGRFVYTTFAVVAVTESWVHLFLAPSLFNAMAAMVEAGVALVAFRRRGWWCGCGLRHATLTAVTAKILDPSIAIVVLVNALSIVMFTVVGLMALFWWWRGRGGGAGRRLGYATFASLATKILDPTVAKVVLVNAFSSMVFTIVGLMAFLWRRRRRRRRRRGRGRRGARRGFWHTALAIVAAKILDPPVANLVL